MTLQNGDIVHICPYGKAPDLLCHAESDTKAQAVALANRVLVYIGASVP